MSFTERECSAMDHAWSEHKDREDRCRLNVTAPSGVLIGCARDKGHDGPCRTRGGIETIPVVDARIEQLARALVALAPFVGLGNNPPAFWLDACPVAEEAVRMAAIIDPTLTVRPSVNGDALYLEREYVSVATVYRVSLRGGQ